MACQSCNNNTGSFIYNTNNGYNYNSTSGVYYDTQDIVYSGPNLVCSGISTNTCLQDIIQTFDNILCQTTNVYSNYNFNCLGNIYTINTESEFVNAITDYACNTKDSLDTVINTTIPALQTNLQNQINNIVNPHLTSPCVNISYNNTSTLNQVIGALSNSVCSIYTQISNIADADWNSCYSVSPVPSTIQEGFNTLISQICSIKNSSVTLPVFDNTSSCLASPGSSDSLVSTINKIKTRLCLTPTYAPSGYTTTCLSISSGTSLDNLLQQVIDKIDIFSQSILNDFSNDFVISNVDDDNLCLGKSIELATPSSQDRFVASDSSDNSPGTLQQKLHAGSNITLDYLTNAGQVTISASSLSSVTSTDSSTIDFSGVGTVGTPLTGSVKISSDGGNTLNIHSDGLYVAPADTTELNFVETSTTSPNVSAGDVTIDVKIDSSQPGNILTYSTNGLYVPTPTTINTVITTTPSTSLNLTATPSGNNYTLSGSVLVSPTATNQILKSLSDGLAVQVSQTSGNAITINGDGIYVATGSAQVNSDYTATSGVSQILNKPTFSNGLTLASNNIKLGGTLVNNTIIDTSTFSASFSSTGNIATNGYQVLSASAEVTNNGTSVTSGSPISPFISSLGYTSTASRTISSSIPVAGSLSLLTPKISGSSTITLSYASGNARALYASFNQVSIPATAATSSTITDIACVYTALYAENPSNLYTITNYSQILIQDSTEFVASNITNRFAILQQGTSDVSRFFGPVQNAGGSTQFTSDRRVKENIISYTKGLEEINKLSPKRFNYTYNQSKVVTGIIAQELEEVIPEAVEKSNFTDPSTKKEYTDFRMVDTNTIIYTMINAIQELSAKVNYLESQVLSLKHS